MHDRTRLYNDTSYKRIEAIQDINSSDIMKNIYVSMSD